MVILHGGWLFTSGCFQIYPPWNLHNTWKWMVGILLSFWGSAYFEGQTVRLRLVYRSEFAFPWRILQVWWDWYIYTLIDHKKTTKCIYKYIIHWSYGIEFDITSPSWRFLLNGCSCSDTIKPLPATKLFMLIFFLQVKSSSELTYGSRYVKCLCVCVMGTRRYMWNGSSVAKNRHRNDDGFPKHHYENGLILFHPK